jgi:predicted Fe-S protein YdhL (DUF1289 family)
VASNTAFLARLSKSRFRGRFRLSAAERAYAQAKGRDTIRSHARDFVSARLAPAEPRNDGMQTPMRGHPVFVAQHATATCCRGCLRTWHGIAKGRPLSKAEQEAVVDLIMEWIDWQLRLMEASDAGP